MKEKSTQDKMLVKIDENSILYKIKKFLKSLFRKKSNNFYQEDYYVEKNNEKQKKLFIEEIKNIENDEIKILKLQKQYRLGEVKEEDLTEEQINSLCILYDKQIKELQKNNEIRKKRILEFRKTYNI